MIFWYSSKGSELRQRDIQCFLYLEILLLSEGNKNKQCSPCPPKETIKLHVYKWQLLPSLLSVSNYRVKTKQSDAFHILNKLYLTRSATTCTDRLPRTESNGKSYQFTKSVYARKWFRAAPTREINSRKKTKFCYTEALTLSC